MSSTQRPPPPAAAVNHNNSNGNHHQYSDNATQSHHNHHDDMLFSPISNAFFMPIPPTTTTTTTTPTPNHMMSLPPSHDNSWIGARCSPIWDDGETGDRNDDDDDDEEMSINVTTDATTTPPRYSHHSQHDPERHMGSSTKQQQQHERQLPLPPVPTERTHLLSSSRRRPFSFWRNFGAMPLHHDPIPSSSSSSSPPPRPNAPPPPIYHYPTMSSQRPKVTSFTPQDPEEEIIQQQQQKRPYLHNNNNNNHHHHRSNLHPLWKSQLSDQGRTHGRFGTSSQQVGYLDRIGLVICSLSGCYLLSMILMGDHHSNDNNTTTTTTTSTWFPYYYSYISPNRATLIQWGALTSPDLAPPRPYWSCLTSLVLCTSLLEWCTVVMAWRLLSVVATTAIPKVAPSLPNDQGRSPHSPAERSSSSTASSTMFVPSTATFPSWYQIVCFYVSSAVTGQLWFFAMEDMNTVAGCASWGTSGILCMMGMLRPRYRFELFLCAACFVILALFRRPNSSVYGTTMSALFGWSMASCGYFVERKQPGVIYVGNSNDLRGMKSITFMGTAGMVLLVSLPVLFMAFKSNRASYY